MTVTYDAPTEKWVVRLDPADVKPFNRYRARLRDQLHEPVGMREAMARLLDAAWQDRRVWADNLTKMLRQAAVEAATAEQMAALEAATDAALGFDPEA